MKSTIETINLTKKYGERVCLDHVCLTIDEGSMCVIAGEPASGKTTLCYILATLVKPTWGEIRLCNWVAGYQNKSIRKVIGLVPTAATLFGDLTIREEIELFGRCYRSVWGLKIDPAYALDACDLNDCAGARPGDASAARHWGVTVARAIVHRPRVLIVDEPFQQCEPSDADYVRSVMGRIRSEGTTVFVATAQPDSLASMADQRLMLRDGEVDNAR